MLYFNLTFNNSFKSNGCLISSFAWKYPQDLYHKLPKPVAPWRGGCCSSSASSDMEHMLPVGTRVHTRTCVHSLKVTPSKADRNTQTQHKWPNPVLLSVLSYAIPQRFALLQMWSGSCLGPGADALLGQPCRSWERVSCLWLGRHWCLCSSVWVWAFHHRTEQVISGNRNGTETLEITQDLGMFRNAWVT